MNRIEGKPIIVTGGSIGLGRAIRLILAREGAPVAVADLHEAMNINVKGPSFAPNTPTAPLGRPHRALKSI